MAFTDTFFLFYFLPATLVLHRLFARAGSYGRLAALVLFAATLAFCALQQPWWLMPLAVVLFTQWIFGVLVDRSHGRARGAWCAGGVTILLGTLAFFRHLPIWLSDHPAWGAVIPHLEVASSPFAIGFAPAGISFYVFEAISYLVDIARGTSRAARGPWRSLIFIGMFPRFVAGPLVRYHQIEKQLAEYPGMKVEQGLTLVIAGLCQKLVFADSCSFFTRYAFDRADAPDFLAAWLGSIAYAWQLYFDFAGYSLIAIGLGRAFGFEFSRNFRAPYLAQSVSEFWQRWHITLSHWIRDYVFLPLALPAQRRGRLAFAVAVLATWFLFGLWHGPRATFLLCYLWFGVWHLVESETRFSERWPALSRRALTLAVILVGWIFLRAGSLAEAGRILESLVGIHGFRFNPTALLANPLAACLMVLAVVYGFVWDNRLDWYERRASVRWATLPLWIGAFGAALLLAASVRTIPFLYFQF